MADIEEPTEFGHPNLTLLTETSDTAILDNLKLRFERKKPYTFAGEVQNVVISVNPYQSLQTDNDSEDSISRYLEKEVFDRPPHVYGAVDLAYLDMKCSNKDTCIVFSGACGAGKTEAAKRVMHYIGSLTEEGRQDDKVHNLLVNSNIVLESFGNAKTTWNNNSSRFGKCVQVAFNFKHVPEGGRVNTCLLESSRVIGRRQDERNFHCFYQLLAGASDSILGDLELERDPCCYHYLERGKEEDTLARVGDKTSFEILSNAMELLQFTEEEQSDIRKTLSAILHLGNVTFQDLCHKSSENSNDENKNQIEKVAKVLDTSHHDVLKYFTRVETSLENGETVEMRPDVTTKEFESQRDKLAMFLYSTLFDHIVRLVNRTVAMDTPAVRHTPSMYILDYQGFEANKDYTNNFYQLCVNYCSEKLHQVFVSKALKQCQEEYKNERLQWTHVDFADNKTVCRMFDNSDQGLLAVMEESEQDSVNVEGLLKRMDKEFGECEHYSSSSCGKIDDSSLTEGQFQIRHFFDSVTYDLTTFSAPKFKGLRDLLSTCQLPMLKKLFTDQHLEAQESQGSATTDNPTYDSSTTLRESVCEPLEKIRSKRCHHVCCILPNVHKSPSEFDEELILNQIRAHCLVELTKIQQAGYYCSMDYSSFVHRYKLLFPEGVPSKTDKEIARELINVHNCEELVTFGKSRIFLKTPKTVNFLEGLRENRKPDAVFSVVNYYRRWHVRTWFKQVLHIFENCASQPKYGVDIQWPEPPVTLNNAYCLLRKIHKNWWARKMVTGLNRSEETVRLKTIAHTLVEGKKFNWLHSEKWLGDELGQEKLNPRHSEYNKKMKAYQTKSRDKEHIVYSCYVMKLNRKMKPDPRICVLSECCLYRLDVNFRAKKRHCVGIGQIVGLSISPGNDQALVIHCEPEVGDIIFYLENYRPASELLAAIWRCYQSKYKKSLPVTVTAQIKYSRPGNRDGMLMCDPGSSLKRNQ